MNIGITYSGISSARIGTVFRDERSKHAWQKK